MLKYLSVNEIETDAFIDNQFRSLNRLEMILMPLEIIHKGAFNGLTKLKYMKISNVKLHTFGEKLFQPIYNLQMFILFECGPHTISVDNLFARVTLKHLKQVLIQNCILGNTIVKTTFWGLRNIDTLGLISNQIDKIGPFSFDLVLGTLTNLLLSLNDLTTLPRNLFRTARKDTIKIDLRYNEWHCDCDIEDLRQIVQSKTNLKFSEIKCASPPELAGVELKYSLPLCSSALYEASMLTWRDEHSVDGNFNIDNDDQHLELDDTDDETKRTFSVRCPKTRRRIAINESSLKRSPVYLQKDKLHFDTENVTNQLVFMYFKQNHTHNRHSCMVHQMTNEKIQIEQTIKMKQLHRICWKRKEIETIIPLDCVTISSYPLKIEPEPEVDANKAWILKDQMHTLIIVCICLSIFVFSFGLLMPYAWMKRMARKKPSLSQRSTMSRTFSERIKQREMIERLKFVSIFVVCSLQMALLMV